MRVSGPCAERTETFPRASQPPPEEEMSNSSEPTSLPLTMSRNLPFCAAIEPGSGGANLEGDTNGGRAGDRSEKREQSKREAASIVAERVTVGLHRECRER